MNFSKSDKLEHSTRLHFERKKNLICENMLSIVYNKARALILLIELWKQKSIRKAHLNVLHFILFLAIDKYLYDFQIFVYRCKSKYIQSIFWGMAGYDQLNSI